MFANCLTPIVNNFSGATGARAACVESPKIDSRRGQG